MAPNSSTTTSQSIYQLKTTLHGSKPPIWRRIQVGGHTNLAKLHDILQITMGWTNSHLHQFVVKDHVYSDPSFELEYATSENAITLDRLELQPKMRFGYEYDMGDYWQHDILVEKIIAPESGIRYPRCLTGKRACPPEDCGGIGGYYALLEAIQDSQHPEHDSMLEWLGDEFGPEAFDLDAVNKQLKSVK
jgi:hypothetical protein